MGVCKIDDNAKVKLFKAVAALVGEQVKAGEPIDLIKVSNRIYDAIFNATNDVEKALSYVSLVPKMVRRLIELNDNFFDHADETDTDKKAIGQIEREIRKSTSENILQNVAKFIGKTSSLSELKEGEEVLDKKKKEEAKSSQVKPTRGHSFSAKPRDMFTTTGQQALPGKKSTPDPEMSFYYGIIGKLNINNKNESGGVLHQGVGLHLSMVSGKLIPDNQMYVKDRDKRDSYDENYFLALTDQDGNFIYFDKDHNVKKEGAIIYFPLRTNPDSVIQTKEESQKQLESIRNLARWIKEDPANRKVVSNITGKSTGYLFSGKETPYVDVSNISNNENLRFHALDNRLAIIYEDGTQILRDIRLKNFDPKRAALLASLAFDDVYLDGKLMTVEQKKAVIEKWLMGWDVMKMRKDGSGFFMKKWSGSKKQFFSSDDVKAKDGMEKALTSNNQKAIPRFDLINSEIDMFDLQEIDGKLTFVSNEVSYQDYLRTITELKVDITEGNVLTPLNGYFEYEVASRVEPKKSADSGIEISSNSTGLGAALTNPTEAAKSKGNLTQSYPVEIDGKKYKDVETAYQKLKDKSEAKTKPARLDSSNYKLMVKLITAKLKQHPRLVSEISKRGGVKWIQSSTHQPTKKNTVWETGGQNWFIQALGDAYLEALLDKTKTEIGLQETDDSIIVYVDGSDFKGKGQIGYGVNTTQDGKDYSISGAFDQKSLGTLEKDLGIKIGSDNLPSNGAMEFYGSLQAIRNTPKDQHITIRQDLESVQMWILSGLMEYFAEEMFSNKNAYNKWWKGLSEEEITELYQKVQDTIGLDQELVDKFSWDGRKGYFATDPTIRAIQQLAIQEIVTRPGVIKYEWVKGHSGEAGNEKVDAIAKDRNSYDTYSEFFGVQTTPETSEEETSVEKTTPAEQVVADQPRTNAQTSLKDLGLDQSSIDKLLEKSTKQKFDEMRASSSQIKKAIAWYNSLTTASGKKLSEIIPVNEMFHAVNSTNPNSVAHWSMSGITLFKGSNYSDLYHESWHAFTQQFLTSDERAQLYEAASKLQGSFTDYTGKEVSFSEANKLQLEEYLAESFREFMLGKKKFSKRTVIGRIFDKIKQLLTWLFNRASYQDLIKNSESVKHIAELYNQLRVGDLIDPVNEADPEFARTGLNRTIRSDTYNFTMEQSMLIRESIDSIFSDYVNKVNAITGKKSAALQIQVDPKMQRAAYKYAKQELTNRRNQLINRMNDVLNRNRKNPDLERTRKIAEYYRHISLLAKTLEEFNIPDGPLSKAGGVIESHQKLSTYLKGVKEIEEQINRLNNNVYDDRSGNSEGFDKLTDPKLMYTLQGIYKRDSSGKHVTNALGFKTPMNAREAFNRIANTLNAFDNRSRPIDIDALYKKMQIVAKNNVFMQDVLDKMGSPYTLTNHNVNNMWTSFGVIIMPVSKVLQVEVVYKDNGQLRSITTIEAGLEVNNLLRHLNSQIKYADANDPNNYIYERAGGGNALDLNRIIKAFPNKKTVDADRYGFLAAIGFVLPDNQDVRADLDSATYKEDIHRIHDAVANLKRFNSASKDKKPIVPEKEKIVVENIGSIVKTNWKNIKKNKNYGLKLPSGQWNNFKAIAQIWFKYSPDSTNLSVTTVEGKTVYQRTLPNTLTATADLINDSDNVKQMTGKPALEHLDPEKLPWMKSSQIMKKLFEKDGSKKPGVVININSLDGLKIRQESEDLSVVKASSADPASKQLIDIINTLQFGAGEGTRHAGKSSTWLIEVQNAKGRRDHYVSLELFGKTQNMGKKRFNVGVLETVDIFMGYLASEYERIQKAKNDPSNKLVRVQKNGSSTIAEAGAQWILFHDILSADVKKKLNALEKLESLEDESYFDAFNRHLADDTALRSEVQNEIWTYLNNLIESETKNFKKFKPNFKLEQKVAAFVKKGRKEIKHNTALKGAIAGYTMNSLIHNIETGMMFYGDPYNYSIGDFMNGKAVEDYHKRNSGAGSTGQTTRIDQAYREFINNNGGLGKRDFDGTLNAAILQDPKVKSDYLVEYKKVAKEAEKARLKGAPKKQIKEALARIDRLFKEYENMDEADAQGYITLDAYRVISLGMNKWTAEQETLFNQIKSGKGVSDINPTALFPPKKFQYWGPVKTPGLSAMAFHKFSLLPLIPGVMKNGLEEMRVKMEEESIDYLTFVTGSKLATVTSNGEIDLMYDGDAKNRKLAFPKKFAKNIVYANYLKEQLSIAPKLKGKTVFSTQMRKLVLEGSWDKGVPKNDKAKNKTANYETSLQRLTRLLFNELKEKAGIDPKTGLVNDKMKLIGYIANALENKEVPGEIIDHIESFKYRVEHDLTLDSTTEAEAVEKLLVTLVYKKVINQKVRGESLIQVSTAGWSKDYNDNLKFYRQAEDGSTLPMQVKIAIQGDFKKMLLLPDVERISNEQGITKLEALNQLIKDEEWLNTENNREMITMLGPRIPVQGLNSMEVMEIAEFLPEVQANIIVLPSEIVAKSGSDFDVDKLSIIMPHIVVHDGIPTVPRYDDNLAQTENRKELLREKTKLERELKNIYKNHKHIKSLIKNDNLFSKEEQEAIETLYDEHYDRLRELDKEIELVEKDWEELNGFEGSLWERDPNFARTRNYPDDFSIEYELMNLYAERSRIQAAFRTSRGHLSEDLTKLNEKLQTVNKTIDAISVSTAEHELLRATADMLLLEDNYVSLITPNTTMDAQDLAEKMVEKVDFGYSSKDNFQEENSGFSPTRIYEQEYNRMKLDHNYVAKAALGIGAVDNTFNILFNRVGAYLLKDVSVGKNGSRQVVIRNLDHNTMQDGSISLSDTYDAENRLKIADVISQFINGWVDVEKNEWIFFIQGNKELANILLFMVQAGVPLRQAVYFLNQPIIHDYYNRVRELRSATLPVTENAPTNDLQRRDVLKHFRGMVFDKIMSEVNEDYRQMVSRVEATYPSEKQRVPTVIKSQRFNFISDLFDKPGYKFSENTLKKRLETGKIGEYTKHDIAVLAHFSEMMENASGVTKLKMALNVDTSKQSTIEEVRQKVKQREDAHNLFPADIVAKLISESPISSFNIQDEMLTMYSPLFPVRLNPNILSIIDSEYETVSKVGEVMGKNELESIELFRNAIVAYIFQNQHYQLTDQSYKGYVVKNTNEYADRVAVIEGDSILINEEAMEELLVLNRSTGRMYSYSPRMVMDYGIASIPDTAFRGVDRKLGLRRYLIEREIQRNLKINSIENITKTAKFKKHRDRMFGLYEEGKLQTETRSLHGLMNTLNISIEEAIDMLAYEYTIRDKALDAINFMGHLFFESPKEKSSYGSRMKQLLDSYPRLRKHFSIFEHLEVRTNDRTGEVNIKLIDTRIARESKEIFMNQLKTLANAEKLSKLRGIGEVGGNEIASFFKRFPVFAYLQSGATTNTSTFNLLSIVDPVQTTEFISAAVADFVKLPAERQKSKLEDGLKKIYRMYHRDIRYNAKNLNDDMTKKLEIKNPKRAEKIPVTLMGDTRGFDRYKAENSGYTKEVLAKINQLKDDHIIIVNTGFETFTDGVIGRGGAAKLLSSDASMGVPGTTFENKTEKPITDKTLEDNKIIIDQAIEMIKDSWRGSGKKLVWNVDGYGQELIGHNPLDSKKTKGKPTAPETFEYLSRRLYEEFGFLNPNWNMKREMHEPGEQMSLFDQVEINTVELKNNPSEYTNHSGGADGADTFWDLIAKELGYETNDVHWREPGKERVDSAALRKEGRVATPMEEELYDEGKRVADMIDRRFGRNVNRGYQHYRYRNYAQVHNADGIFAISVGFGTMEDGKTFGPLDRGTLYAIYGGIYLKKPTFVYDQKNEVWRTWNYETKTWETTGTPELTKNFAGVGTRTLTPAGKQAIKDVMIKTFKSEDTVNVKTVLPLTSTEVYNAIIEDLRTCNR